MEHQQILERAIRKAIDGGWEDDNHYTHDGAEKFAKYMLHWDATEHYIFNHDFAKALWGEEDKMIIDTGDRTWWQPWQSHLREMVVAADPIKYLGDHL